MTINYVKCFISYQIQEFKAFPRSLHKKKLKFLTLFSWEVKIVTYLPKLPFMKWCPSVLKILNTVYKKF